jgi:rubrerythrin
MLEPYQKNIIELLFKQELLLSQLYELFANKFPEYSEFWMDLSKEEKTHAQWIKKLYHAEKKDLVLFDEGKTKTYTLQTVIKHTENVIAQVKEGEFTLEMAIGHTLDFERSILEKDFIKFFKTTDDKVKAVMDKLDKETKKHISQIQELKLKLY